MSTNRSSIPPRPMLDYAAPGSNPIATPRKLSDRAIALLNAINFAAGTFFWTVGMQAEDSIHWRFFPLVQLMLSIIFMTSRKRTDGLFWFATANMFLAIFYLFLGFHGIFVT